MSYCRWSSDDFQCDVYCYESVYGGFETHVAGLRRVFKEPLPPEVPFEKEHLEAFVARRQKIMAMCEESTLVKIGLPCDGKDFIDDDAGSCAARLMDLKSMGYRVPQYAIDALFEEAKENTK